MEMLFTGDFIPAERALELQMVNHVVPHDKLMEKAEEVIRKIMANAPLSVRAIKETGVRGLDMNMEQRVRLASLISAQVSKSADTAEGLKAFAEKRDPVWTGK